MPAAARAARRAVGRSLTSETIRRFAVLEHLRQETWRGLDFARRNSQSARRFARVEAMRQPKKSALQATVGAVSADTWEHVNRPTPPAS